MVPPLNIFAIYGETESRTNKQEAEEKWQNKIEELNKIENRNENVIIIGDLNCHHARWLYHSNGVSTEGRALERLRLSNGFQEFVRKPTREKYLLDLVLTDMSDAVSTRLLPKIAAHHGVLACFNFSLERLAFLMYSPHQFVVFQCPP